MEKLPAFKDGALPFVSCDDVISSLCGRPSPKLVLAVGLRILRLPAVCQHLKAPYLARPVVHQPQAKHDKRISPLRSPSGPSAGMFPAWFAFLLTFFPPSHLLPIDLRLLMLTRRLFPEFSRFYSSVFPGIEAVQWTPRPRIHNSGSASIDRRKQIYPSTSISRCV